jgi:hypothetical protein
LWKRQEGLVFLSPEVLAVYQVIERAEPIPLARRDSSGGVGKYHLQISFLQASDGKLLKQIRLVTSEEVSQVLPTREGRFIVRTGQTLHLFSATLEEISALQLPLDGPAKHEWWDTDVSPSGAELWLAHHEDFGFRASVGPRTSVEVRDTSTLAVLAEMKAKVINDLSAGDGFATTANPDTGTGYGVLSEDGVWKQVAFRWETACPNYLKALPQQFLAAFGCSNLRILQLDGTQIFQKTVGSGEAFVAIFGVDSLMAVRVDKRKSNPFDSAFKSRPSRVLIYDLNGQSEIASIPVSGELVKFTVSLKGCLATIEGKELKVFDVAPPPPQYRR